MRKEIEEKSAEKGKVLSEAETDKEILKKIIVDSDMLTDPESMAKIAEVSPEVAEEIEEVVEGLGNGRGYGKEFLKNNEIPYDSDNTGETKNKPIDIKLKFNENWTQAQREEAIEKLKILSQVKTVKTPVKRKGVSAAERYRAIYGEDSIPEGYDIDHIVDLQLGGIDDIINMKPLDRSVNRSLGVQIKNAIAKYPYYTEFGNFTIS